ncbi:alpha/beta hydrolase-fold protein [Nocardia sp. NPDC050697]|uniref:alpha/beta hydrolase n=1 Tax=Nocardia sp. NPDC050697 TaxID=3155158 RepID=UPI0033F0EAA6
MLDLALLDGAVPALLAVSALTGLIWLLAHSGPRPITACLVAAGAVTATAAWLATDVFVLFPDPLEPRTYCSIGVAVFAALLAVAGRRPLGVLIALLVIAACANQVNADFAAYPTLRSVFEPHAPNEIAFRDLRPAPVAELGPGPLDRSWQPPPGLPAAGRITRARIPGAESGFQARPAEIYLPPAYFAVPRPRLPVLVLLSGQPGSPDDWLTSGNLVATMDGFAARHHGLAPVVVVADGTGGTWKNPLCADTRRARAATYLAVDVPAWIHTHLTVADDAGGWAIAGSSYGGTCAIQLALARPGVYPTFLGMSAESQPSLGDPERTLREGFGGDTAAFARADPLALLRARGYPELAGVVSVGAADDDTVPEAKKIADALRAGGARVRFLEVPGGHDWTVWSGVLEQVLPWLAQRLGIVRYP